MQIRPTADCTAAVSQRLSILPIGYIVSPNSVGGFSMIDISDA